MPKSSLFEFNVVVNNKPLKEYVLDSEFYVESDLYSEVSYLIEETENEGNIQKYPVTPFSIQGSITNVFDCPVYLKLCVDGHQIWMKPFPPRCMQSYSVNGYKHQQVIRELLFTLPKMEEDNTPRKKEKRTQENMKMMGTITMECIEAVELGKYYSYRPVFNNTKPGSLSANPNFSQGLKKYGNAGVTAREGRSICEISKGNKSRLMTRYRVGKEHFGGVTVKYRPRITLQDMGINDEAWVSNIQQRQFSGESKVLSTVDNTEENFTEKFRKMNCHSPGQQQENQEYGGAASPDQNSGSGKFFCLSPLSKHKMTVGTPSALKSGFGPPSNLKMLVTSPSDMNRQSKINCFSPSDRKVLGKLDVNSPSDMLQKTQNYQERLCIKTEAMDTSDDGKQYRMIEIDDDLQILEEVDDDVIWMGDDSCCFLDVSDPDISLVDLCEEVE